MMMEPSAVPASSQQAERVILVSLMKSGTHLLQELMVALGYGMYGQARIAPEMRPVLDSETRWRIARMVYDPGTLAGLTAAGDARFTAATDRAWEALAWSWQIRFGMPLRTWYSADLIDHGLVAEAHSRAVGSGFADTPRMVCWVFNEFDIRKVDGNFLHEWMETGEPRIIFNYRDPRDVILSMVNFLSGKTGRGFSAFNDFPVFSRILESKLTMEEKLTYALTDSSFPPGEDLRRMFWLRNHPNVCVTSFEDLVGPDGGGSEAARMDALTRIFEFLNVTDKRPGDVAEKLFNRDVFTFYRGQIGAWREAFTPEQERLAEERFGNILPIYGYK
jgi:hypothetical protein